MIDAARRIDDGRSPSPSSRRCRALTFARLAPTLPRAGHIGHPAVTTYEATPVRLDRRGTVAYADGERIGPLPVTTTCVPGALRVAASRSHARHRSDSDVGDA